MMTRSLVALVMIAASCRGSETPPAVATRDTATTLHVELADSGPVMQLPEPMRAALQQYAPNFRAWRLEEYDERVHEKARPPRSLPIFATGSDMNGDGSIDLALYGHDGANEMLFVLMSEGGKYRAVELRRAPLPPADQRAPQAHYLEPPADDRPGFIESIEGVAGVFYLWKDGRFHEEVIGD